MVSCDLERGSRSDLTMVVAAGDIPRPTLILHLHPELTLILSKLEYPQQRRPSTAREERDTHPPFALGMSPVGNGLLPASASTTALAAILLSIVLSSIMGALRSNKWKPQAKHVFITGGSQGLGLAVAELLASKGAHITICSRTESKLREAVRKVKVRREELSVCFPMLQTFSRWQLLIVYHLPPFCYSSSRTVFSVNTHAQAAAKSDQQKIEYVAADVSTFEGAKRAIESCSVVPDTVFCCAGGAQPGFFLNQTESDFEQGMKTDYWTCLATAHVSVSVLASSAADKACSASCLQLESFADAPPLLACSYSSDTTAVPLGSGKCYGAHQRC